MKRLAIILLGIFALTLFPILPAEASGDGNKGTVFRNEDGEFKSIEWQIISRGGSGTRYRVIERQITIDGHTASFSPTKTNPKPGETIMQTVTIDAAELASGMGVSPQDVEGWMNSGVVAQVSVTIQIIDGNDNVLGTYTDCESLRTAMKNKGFPQTDIDYVGSFWGIADDPDRPELVNLKVVSIRVLDNSGMDVTQYNSIDAGTICTVEAVFKNESDKQDTAHFRLISSQGGSVLTYNPQNLTFGPGLKTVKWDNVIIFGGANTFTTSVNYMYMGLMQDWMKERFNDQFETTYEDNKMSTATVHGKLDAGIPESKPEEPLTPGNLSIRGELYDETEGKVVTSQAVLSHGHSLQMTVKSTFDESGFAAVRMYKRNKDTEQVYQSFDTIYAFMPAGSTSSPAQVQLKQSASVQTGYEYIVTVNAHNSSEQGNDSWISGLTYELFNGKTETRKDDNYHFVRPSILDDIVWEEFGPVETGETVYIPGLKAEKITKDVYGWKRVKVNLPKKPKIKIRLAPSESD